MLAGRHPGRISEWASRSSLEYTWNRTSMNALSLKGVALSIHALHIQYFKEVQRAQENVVLMTIYLGQWGQSCGISTCCCTHHPQLPLPKHTHSRARKEIFQIETNIPLRGWRELQIAQLAELFCSKANSTHTSMTLECTQHCVALMERSRKSLSSQSLNSSCGDWLIKMTQWRIIM